MRSLWARSARPPSWSTLSRNGVPRKPVLRWLPRLATSSARRLNAGLLEVVRDQAELQREHVARLAAAADRAVGVHPAVHERDLDLVVERGVGGGVGVVAEDRRRLAGEVGAVGEERGADEVQRRVVGRQPVAVAAVGADQAAGVRLQVGDPALHRVIAGLQDADVAVAAVERERDDRARVAPARGAVAGAGDRRDVREGAVGGLAVAQRLQPLAEVVGGVAVERAGRGEGLDVTGPAQALVALGGVARARRGSSSAGPSGSRSGSGSRARCSS